MSSKFYENALTALKKANTSRKMVLAGKAGYDSVEAYKSFLESQVSKPMATPEKVSETTAQKPVVIVIDVIDCSGSMSGPKVNNAIQGINSGVYEMKKETLVDYKYAICDFAGRGDCNVSPIKDIKDVSPFRFTTRGMTALNDAVANVLTKAKGEKTPEQKVLVNIYTDGGENNSRVSQREVKELVNECEANGFTITFIGTEQDTRDIINDYNIKESNTQSYDGTARGLQESMVMNMNARGSYADKLSKGLDVTVGFFKEVKK